MRVKSVFALIVIVWILAFLILNWQIVSAPARINLVLGVVETSVGAAMLSLGLPVILLLIIYIGNWHSTLLMENRRLAKELQAQRTLVDNAEASRVTELGTMIRNEIVGLDQRLQMAMDTLRDEFHDTERSMAATLAEMDDRIKRSTDRSGIGVG